MRSAGRDRRESESLALPGAALFLSSVMANRKPAAKISCFVSRMIGSFNFSDSFFASCYRLPLCLFATFACDCIAKNGWWRTKVWLLACYLSVAKRVYPFANILACEAAASSCFLGATALFGRISFACYCFLFTCSLDLRTLLAANREKCSNLPVFQSVESFQPCRRKTEVSRRTRVIERRIKYYWNNTEPGTFTFL